MSTRTTYIPSENAAIPNDLNESTPLISRVLRDDIVLQESWNQKATRKTRDIVKRNIGLLLIAVAQLFFSSMNVAVKNLNSLDPPVSTMQVRQFCRLLFCSSRSFRVNKLIAVRMVHFTFLIPLFDSKLACNFFEGHYASLFRDIHVILDLYYRSSLLPNLRIATGVRDPILGPSGVRLLLLLRGFSGCVHLRTPSFPDVSMIRFIGLFGIYFSLQYLSLSDATVLTFLTPICTVFTGAVFLGETFSHRQILAGSKQHNFFIPLRFLNIPLSSY